jgi:hypothetical protein
MGADSAEPPKTSALQELYGRMFRAEWTSRDSDQN